MGTKVEPELPENATQEDVKQLVEKVIDEQKQDDAADQEAVKKEDDRSDSQRVADDHAGGEPSKHTQSGMTTSNQQTDYTDAGDETPAGEGTTAASDEDAGDAAEKASEKAAGEEQGQEEEASRDWLDDDLKAELSELGIEGDELDDFTSREEVDRVMGFLYRDAKRAGEKLQAAGGEEEQQAADQEGREQRTRGKDGRFTKKEWWARESKEPAPKAETDPAGYKAELDPALYDEAVVKEFSKLHAHFSDRQAHLEDRFARLEAAEQQRAVDALEVQFDSAIDALEMPELFGTTGKETKAQKANRQQALETYDTIALGLQAKNRECNLDSTLMRRIAHMEFPEHLSKQQRKALTRRITSQSKRRQGGGAVRPQDPHETLEQEMERYYDQLEKA